MKALQWRRWRPTSNRRRRRDQRGFPRLAGANAPGHTFVVLEVEPFSEQEQNLEQPPFDGPELKFRFGRLVERRTHCNIFGYRL